MVPDLPLNAFRDETATITQSRCIEGSAVSNRLNANTFAERVILADDLVIFQYPAQLIHMYSGSRQGPKIVDYRRLRS